jgi:hypothetical protein
MDTSSDIRQRWLDEERSVRRRMAEVGVISPDQLKVIHSGRSTAIAEGRIEDADGRLHALCTTTCLLFPMA